MKIDKKTIILYSIGAIVVAGIVAEIYFVEKPGRETGNRIKDFGVEEIHEMGSLSQEETGKLINEKYSYRDFTGQSLRDVSPEELNNTVIVGSSFYQENEPYKKIFPDNINGVIFRRSNLDNVYVPPGNIIEGGSHRQIKTQNDWDDWLVGKDLNPIEPLDKEERLAAGVSVDPKDIPAVSFTPEQRKEFEGLFYKNQ